MRTEDWIEMAFVFRDRPRPDELADLFDSLLARPDADTDDLDIAAWNDTSDIHHYSGTASDAAAACDEYLNSTIGIRFKGFKLQIGSGYSDGLLADIPHVTVRAESHPFTDPSNGCDDAITDRRKRFVHTLSRCTEVLQPRWGFGKRDGVAIGENQKIEQLVNRERPPLYEYNAFARETVEELGRETVRTVPAWFVQELDTGGIFISVREPPLRCGFQSDACHAAAEHLGLELATPERSR